MIPRTVRLLASSALLALAACAGSRTPRPMTSAEVLETVSYGPLALPGPGELADAVLARNGEPTRREPDGAEEVWIYVRTAPPGSDLSSRIAVIRMRDGRVASAEMVPTIGPGRDYKR